MKKYIILSRDKDNNIKYISNTSPLLWTDDINKAKIFRSEGEILNDLNEHMMALEKMSKELNLRFETQLI
jgi:hypothetical protein